MPSLRPLFLLLPWRFFVFSYLFSFPSKSSVAALQNREGGDRSRSGGGGDFQRSDSSPGSRPSSVLPDLLTSSPGQRQDKSTSEEVRFSRPFKCIILCLLHCRSVRAFVYASLFLDMRQTGMNDARAVWRSRQRVTLWLICSRGSNASWSLEFKVASDHPPQ